MKYILSILTLLLTVACNKPQEEFVVRGQVDLPDGTVVGVIVNTLEQNSKEIGEAVVKDGRFEIRAKIDEPWPAILTTNNLALVEQNGWPVDSIHWNYLDFFIENCEYTLTPDLKIEGGEVQRDYLDYQAAGSQEADPWAYIDSHPTSAVSAHLAYGMLQRAYRLTAEQVAHLDQTITSVPANPAAYERLKQSLKAAEATVTGAPLASLEVKDREGNIYDLRDLVPQDKYVLIDFWASWCGICLYQMPENRKIAEEMGDRLAVVAVSIDTKEDAWIKSMEKHPEPWPQYVTTATGFQQLTDVLQIGNGVPYYILIGPDGRVIKSPDGPEETRALLGLPTASEE